ncbi:uncharacterized protein TRIADDRAFT_61851 [Trichoplax adhaerens]|uniref:C-type lectin domain-containing protein n=1 Tax=Trichoplax adhaerens TaxID=10228 RepID=B3SC61_TRIAD|nr:predicted protein [Trichoplax adhaerens]EDV19664.1 predicted protein [Trichoplax adhaerens]|eukprot:XP_002117821.1 predicted protein [Trichoplax adhaerens]
MQIHLKYFLPFVIWIFGIQKHIQPTSGSEPCPDGWHFYGQDNICLHLVDKAAKFDVARSICQDDFKAWLLYINGADKENFINTKIISDKYKFYWLGLKDVIGDDKPESHRWLAQNKTLTENSYTNWANDKQPNIRSHECAIICFQQKPKWLEEKCYLNNKYICEKAANPSATSSVTKTSFERQNYKNVKDLIHLHVNANLMSIKLARIMIEIIFIIWL